MTTVYMVCDYCDEKARGMGALNIQVERMGMCRGRIVREDGSPLAFHQSSSIGWLRLDLQRGLTNAEQYNIVDLLDQPVPERFRLPERVVRP